MDVLAKLTILTDSAKYDVACTSSGSERPGDETGLGSTVAAGPVSYTHLDVYKRQIPA